MNTNPAFWSGRPEQRKVLGEEELSKVPRTVIPDKFAKGEADEIVEDMEAPDPASLETPPAAKAAMNKELDQAIAVSLQENAADEAPAPQAAAPAPQATPQAPSPTMPMGNMASTRGGPRGAAPGAPIPMGAMATAPGTQPAPRQLGRPAMPPQPMGGAAGQPDMNQYRPGMNIPMYQFSSSRGQR